MKKSYWTEPNKSRRVYFSCGGSYEGRNLLTAPWAQSDRYIDLQLIP